MEVVAAFVNMNGTSEERLVDALGDVRQKLSEAMDLLRETSPNGRDYCQGGNVSLDEAASQCRRRGFAMKNLMAELEVEMEMLQERQQRREFVPKVDNSNRSDR